jgi:choline-sulfatase
VRSSWHVAIAWRVLRIGILVLSGFLTAHPGLAETAKRTNHVLIVVDTLRADRTQPYGYPSRTSPGLAKLAAEGAVFSLAYAPTSATAPSHASLFTGRYPASHRLTRNGQKLSPTLRTLAEILQAEGYQTAAVVSSFVLDEQFGFAQGFATYDDEFDPDAASVAVEEWEGHEVGKAFDRRADDTTKRATRWLWGGRDPRRPFFLFVHYFDPHAPYHPPDSFHADLPLPSVDKPFADPKAAFSYRVKAGAYEAEIAFTDREIERLLGVLDSLGLAEDTLVVVTADHGEGLLDHGTWIHGLDVYEETVRVPLLMRLPQVIPEGTRIAEPVELVDLAPTILALLGIDGSAHAFQGRNIAPALRGQARLEPRHPVFFYRRHYSAGFRNGVFVDGELYGVRQGSWKYIRHDRREADELFDLEADPGEQRNLVGRSPERSDSLGSLLQEWMRTHVEPEEAWSLGDSVRQALEALGYGD